MRRRLLVGLVLAVVGGYLVPFWGPSASALSGEVVYRRIHTPAEGAFSYSNTWGASRGGGSRQHEGNDLMGQRLQPLLAARDGEVVWTRTDGNNMLSIRDADGWRYVYIHVNNDSPGTDDGANPRDWILFPGIEEGSEVKAGQPVAYMGDSGNAEGTSPHVHFEMHRPDGEPVNPYWSLMLSQGRRVNDRCWAEDNPTPKPSATSGVGYWSVTNDGGVYSYGTAPFLGSMSGKRLASPVIAMTRTPSGLGYWQLSADGGIFSFGDARFFGSTGDRRLNAPIVGMAPTPTGKGYWLVATDGGIFSFGDAKFAGSTGAIRLSKPIVSMAPTKSGKGYWLVASDGGVFAFGDAKYHGSTNGNTIFPVVDIARTPSGNGYWMLTSLGSVLPFGDAGWHGAVDKVGFCSPPGAVRLVPTSSGRGYWIQTGDGNTFAYGDAWDWGSIKRSGIATKPAVDLAAAG